MNIIMIRTYVCIHFDIDIYIQTAVLHIKSKLNINDVSCMCALSHAHAHDFFLAFSLFLSLFFLSRLRALSRARVRSLS